MGEVGNGIWGIVLEGKKEIVLLVVGGILAAIGTLFRKGIGLGLGWVWGKVRRKKPGVVVKPRFVGTIKNPAVEALKDNMRAHMNYHAGHEVSPFWDNEELFKGLKDLHARYQYIWDFEVYTGTDFEAGQKYLESLRGELRYILNKVDRNGNGNLHEGLGDLVMRTRKLNVQNLDLAPEEHLNAFMAEGTDIISTLGRLVTWVAP